MTHCSRPLCSTPLILALLMGAMMFGGCASTQQSPRVESFNNGDQRIALNAEDVVHTMRRAGFEDDHILDIGPRMRNALAVEGGARIRRGAFTMAMFMADNGELYGVSLENGSFRYIPAATIADAEHDLEQDEGAEDVPTFVPGDPEQTPRLDQLEPERESQDTEVTGDTEDADDDPDDEEADEQIGDETNG